MLFRARYAGEVARLEYQPQAGLYCARRTGQSANAHEVSNWLTWAARV